MSRFGGASNLPPGCSMSDLPGSRPEDIRMEKAYEQFLDFLDEIVESSEDYEIMQTIVKSGLPAMRKLIRKRENEIIGERNEDYQIDAWEGHCHFCKKKGDKI